MVEFPRDTVTFLFSDIEGSTRLWERDHAAMNDAVERHFRLLEDNYALHRGVLYKKVGDGTQAAFHTAPEAIAAALDAQRALLAAPWPELPHPPRVRMALHTGVAEPKSGDYLAAPLNRLGRLIATSHGGQILLTQVVQQLARDHMEEGVSLRDLGTHCLRDLYHTEQIFQLVHAELDDQFPSLMTLRSRPNNLPQQATPTFGREAEIEEVVDLLHDPQASLVTLTGAPGIGKTQIALQVGARLLDDFRDGVFFVDLVPLRNPDQVPLLISKILSPPLEGTDSMTQALLTYFQMQDMLLILDNVEHIRGSVPLIAELVRVGQNSKVLVTSREPLHLLERGERRIVVGPLPIPDLTAAQELSVQHLLANQAVALFCYEAKAIDSRFVLTDENATHVAAICSRLEGIPLAIKLAATRVERFELPELLERLEKALPELAAEKSDLSDRHRTMRASIAWSFNLLSDDARDIFQSLSVFRGPFSMKAACKVNQLHRDKVVEEIVGDLVSQNLLLRSRGPNGRSIYSMLAVVREFGNEMLYRHQRGKAAEAAKQLCTVWYRGLSRRACGASGPREDDLLEELDAEFDNVLVALGHYASRGEYNKLFEMSEELFELWKRKRRYADGVRWLTLGLDKATNISPEKRADALGRAGYLARRSNDLFRARDLHQEALNYYRRFGNDRFAARELNSLAIVADSTGDYTLAEHLHLERVSLAHQLRDQHLEAEVWADLGGVALRFGETDRAESLFARCLEFYRGAQDQEKLAVTLTQVGHAAMHQGDLQRSQSLLEEGLAMLRELGSDERESSILSLLGDVALRRGDLEGAKRFHLESLGMYRSNGDRTAEAWPLSQLGSIAEEEGDVLGAARLYRQSLELHREAGRRHLEATMLSRLAALAQCQGFPERAEVLEQQSLQMRRQHTLC